MARIGLLGKIICSFKAAGYRQTAESAHWPSFSSRGSLGTMQTETERREAGAAARSHLPRSKLARWGPPAGRQSPVAILAAQGTSRIQDLLPIRYERMRASAFAFLRGAAAIMAADLGSQPNTGLRVQLCGDAHLANFGSYASPEGNPVFDVNDFDETFPGPFEWDIKRLATSFYVNGLDQGESVSSCRALAARCVRQYRRHMQRLAGLTPLEAWTSKIDMAQAIEAIDPPKLRRRLERRLRDAMDASQAHYNLVDEDNTIIKDGGNIRHTETFAAAIDAAFAAYPGTLQPQYADLVSRYDLADRALKIVGIGSVGTLCAIGLFASGDGAPLLLQVKEAQNSVLAPFAGGPPVKCPGERVVTGQRRLQAQSDIFLGWTKKPIENRFFYVRRLKDSRLANVGAALEADMLPFAAGLCGRTLARAHGRAGDAAMLAGYMGDGEVFDDAITDFAESYARQNVTDYEAFKASELK
jgi:uncharacterized protein (DUF2252 family)